MAKIKICGLTNEKDYQFIADAGVEFAGLIFYKKSPRYINEICAKNIIHKKGIVHNIGVFVNENIEEIQRIYEFIGLDIIQLHGDETPDYCRNLQLPYWKAIRIKDNDSLIIMDKYNCDTFLIDAYDPENKGGTGKTINFNLIEQCLSTGRNIMVAGGLSLSNIEAVLNLNPYGVDINSSVEKIAGEKDLNKIEAIIKVIRKFKKENK